MTERPAGYREIEHTADWELEAWGPDLPALLEQAALGMASLAGLHLVSGPRQERRFEIDAGDPESLVVSFLSEILYYGEEQGIGFDSFDLDLNGMQLSARLEGAPIQSIDKDIKAVTWHKLEVRFEEKGVKVRVVFDV
jgi:SHS2 domain-containing protein